MTESPINPSTSHQIESIREFCQRKQPLVVISTMTFNHELYLRDALDGFVMQRTTFPFVAVVHDDASTDGTANILREYAERYPDIILPIYESENQYSKRDGSLRHIMREARAATGARYVALCEGDDYWTDPTKLQRQVDFLELHPDYTMVFANALYLYEDGTTATPLKIENREYKAIEVYKKYFTPTPTVVLRSEIYDHPLYLKLSNIKNAVFGDVTLFVCCGVIGKIYGSDDIVCAYRRLSTGAANYLVSHLYKFLKNHIAISKELGKEFVKIDRQRFNNQFSLSLKTINKNTKDKCLFIMRYMWFAPKESATRILRMLYKFLFLQK